MKHKRFARLLSMLLVVVTMFGVMSLPANAASLNDSGTAVSYTHLTLPTNSLV